MHRSACAQTLAEVRVGTTALIVANDPEASGLRLHQRLAELGLRPGLAVRVLMRTPGGGRVIGVGHARVALGREVLRAITVRQVATDPR